MHVPAPRSGHSLGTENRLQPIQILFDQSDLRRLDVFLEVRSRLVAWNGNDLPALRHYPRQRQLRRCGPFFSRDLLELRKQRDVSFEISWLESWMAVAAIALGQILGAMHDAGEEAAPERRIGHEAHIEITTGLNIAPLRIAGPKRVFHLQRANRINFPRPLDRVCAR